MNDYYLYDSKTSSFSVDMNVGDHIVPTTYSEVMILQESI